MSTPDSGLSSSTQSGKISWKSCDINLKEMTLASTVQNTSWVATLTTSSDMQDFHEGAFHHANNRRGREFPYIGKATNTQWDGVPDLAFHPASGNIAHMYWAAPVKCTELKLKNLQGYRVPECGSWVKVKVKNMASNKDVAELQFNGGQWSGKADTVYDVGAMDVGDKVDFGFDNVNDYACDNARLRFVLECTPLPSEMPPTPPPTPAPTPPLICKSECADEMHPWGKQEWKDKCDKTQQPSLDQCQCAQCQTGACDRGCYDAAKNGSKWENICQPRDNSIWCVACPECMSHWSYKFTEEGLRRQASMYYDPFSVADRCASLDKDPHHLNSANQGDKREQRRYEDNEDLLNAHHQFLEIEIGKHTVTAVATQGDATLQQFVKEYKLSFQKEPHAPWVFYRGSETEDGLSSIVDATPLTGNIDATSVRKNYITPFEATAIRIHPIEWVGISMALRVEVFACLTQFDFSPLKEFVNRLDLHGSSPSVCNALTSNQRVQTSFERWTLGRGGSGAIYQSALREFAVDRQNGTPHDTQDEWGPHQLQLSTENEKLKEELASAKEMEASVQATLDTVLKGQPELRARWQEALAAMEMRMQSAKQLGESSTEHTTKAKLIVDSLAVAADEPALSFKAYQQRTVTGGGLITKQLVCFSKKGLSTTKQCCVRKSSKKFSGTQWTDQELRTLLA